MEAVLVGIVGSVGLLLFAGGFSHLAVYGAEKTMGSIVSALAHMLAAPGELRLAVARRRLAQAQERTAIETEIAHLQEQEHRAALRALEGGR